MRNEETHITAEKILNAAERLFAENGFNGTSLRHITDAAKVNLASVNYHFGDKETLYTEVIHRRIQPLNAARLAKLDQVIALAGDQPPPLPLVIEILVKPVFEMHQDPARGGQHIVKLIARCLTEPLPFMSELVTTEFQTTIARFSQAIRRSVGHLTPEDFMWRMSFVVGSMQHTLATLHQMGQLTRGICKSHDHEAALSHFVTSAVAVFTAPASPTRTSSVNASA
ncbi:TetR/AcrR family transcriptional regulator [Oleiharenicola lentus]|uniref:TetR/AcrR family transcriptional regulator n=1 Tax=Oleiharenicola lentus TaxID=2508720 RepID=UPI003F66243D